MVLCFKAKIYQFTRECF